MAGSAFARTQALAKTTASALVVTGAMLATEAPGADPLPKVREECANVRAGEQRGKVAADAAGRRRTTPPDCEAPKVLAEKAPPHCEARSGDVGAALSEAAGPPGTCPSGTGHGEAPNVLAERADDKMAGEAEGRRRTAPCPGSVAEADAADDGGGRVHKVLAEETVDLGRPSRHAGVHPALAPSRPLRAAGVRGARPGPSDNIAGDAHNVLAEEAVDLVRPPPLQAHCLELTT